VRIRDRGIAGTDKASGFPNSNNPATCLRACHPLLLRGARNVAGNHVPSSNAPAGQPKTRPSTSAGKQRRRKARIDIFSRSRRRSASALPGGVTSLFLPSFAPHGGFWRISVAP
jgi:hypothetical protein